MRLGLGMGLTRGSAAPSGGPTYDDTMVGVTGVVDYWDIADLTTVWQDSGKVTAVSADGDPIGYVAGKLAALDWQQTTSAARPAWRQSGGATWLENDGIDDQGLQLVGGDITTAKTFVGLFRYKAGTESTFSDFHTLWVKAAGITGNPAGGVGRGDSTTANIRTADVLDEASVSGAAYGAAVLPLTYKTVALRDASLTAVLIGSIASGNNNSVARAWPGRFTPILISTASLAASEIATIATACADRFGST